MTVWYYTHAPCVHMDLQRLVCRHCATPCVQLLVHCLFAVRLSLGTDASLSVCQQRRGVQETLCCLCEENSAGKQHRELQHRGHRRDQDIRLLRSIHNCTCVASCTSCNLSLWLSFLRKRLLENTRCSSCSALCAWKNTGSQGCFGVSCSCLISG